MKISQSIFFDRQEALRRSGFLIMVFLMLPVISCAKVGNPMPPLPSDVVLVDSLQLLQSGQDLYLTFPHPVRELSEIEVYRLCEGEDKQIIETDPVSVLSGAEIKKLSFLNRSYVPAPDGSHSSPCLFTVRTKNLRGKQSGFSNQVSWKPAELPAPPTGLKTETSETEIRIEWEISQDSKPEPGKTHPEFLVNLNKVTRDTFFIVSDFTFGQPVSFEVRTIDRSRGTILLSEPLVLESFVPEDIFPPRAPSGLIVVRMPDRVQLTWDDNAEADLSGYYVYRKAAGGEMLKISPLVPINRFVDEDPPDGVALLYSVTAVDQWGNESSATGVAQ